MIVKKEWIDKKTGEKTVQMTSDKEGFKVVKDGDGWKEVKMAQSEREARNHGKDSQSRGQEGTKAKLSGQSKANIESEYKKQKKEKEDINNTNVIIKSSKVNESKKDLDKQKKKVDDLALKLKKAKLDYNATMLDQKIQDFEKKEGYYKMASQVNERDRMTIKDRNKYFVKTVPKDEELEGDIIDHIEQIVGKPQTPEVPCDIKEEVSGVSIEEKLDRAEKIQEVFYGKQPEKIKEDVIDRLTSVLEAPEDEEDEEEDDGLGLGDEEGGDDLGLGDEDGGDDLGLGDEEDGDDEESDEEEIELDPVEMQNNEIAMHTRVNNFNVEENNVYDFYDFIADKIADPTAKDALNSEYSRIEPTRRKVTSAKEFFDRVVKRTNIMNKKEADTLNQDAESGDEGGDEGGLGI